MYARPLTRVVTTPSFVGNTSAPKLKNDKIPLRHLPPPRPLRCRLQMPLRLALGVGGTVAGHRLGALRGGAGDRCAHTTGAVRHKAEAEDWGRVLSVTNAALGVGAWTGGGGGGLRRNYKTDQYKPETMHSTARPECIYIRYVKLG